MSYYVIIDTNVLVSALLNRDSTSGQIVNYADKGIVKPLINGDILKEYARVLARKKKYDFSVENIDIALNKIKRFAEPVNPPHLDIVLPDESDRPFYEAAMHGSDTKRAWLITGNRKHFQGVPLIASPTEMWQMIVMRSASD